jgi:hypothetical protein
MQTIVVGLVESGGVLGQRNNAQRWSSGARYNRKPRVQRLCNNDRSAIATDNMMLLETQSETMLCVLILTG